MTDYWKRLLAIGLIGLISWIAFFTTLMTKYNSCYKSLNIEVYNSFSGIRQGNSSYLNNVLCRGSYVGGKYIPPKCVVTGLQKITTYRSPDNSTFCNFKDDVNNNYTKDSYPKYLQPVYSDKHKNCFYEQNAYMECSVMLFGTLFSFILAIIAPICASMFESKTTNEKIIQVDLDNIYK